jgi:hypothetical protein
MIAWASGFGTGVGRFRRPLRGVGVLATQDTRMDTMRWVQSVSMVPPGAGVLRLLGPGVAVGVIIERRCVENGVEVMC